jgi:hypothetical protein
VTSALRAEGCETSHQLLSVHPVTPGPASSRSSASTAVDEDQHAPPEASGRSCGPPVPPRSAELRYTPAGCVLTDAAQLSSGKLPILVAADRRHGRT